LSKPDGFSSKSDEFRISPAETNDVIVQPHENAAYTIFPQSEDRSGYARGTLAPSEGMVAEIPQMDPRPMRTMADMGMGGMAGMNMAGMNMTGIDGMKAKDMRAMAKNGTTQDGMKAWRVWIWATQVCIPCQLWAKASPWRRSAEHGRHRHEWFQ
jgi:FtsP/CotA-like multicopper oxidase with cupredoxin domain